MNSKFWKRQLHLAKNIDEAKSIAIMIDIAERQEARQNQNNKDFGE